MYVYRPSNRGAGQVEDALVVAGHEKSAEGDVQAGRLGGVVAVVVEVGLVDDFRDPPQHRVGEVVVALREVTQIGEARGHGGVDLDGLTWP